MQSSATASAIPATGPHERSVEWTVESRKHYDDPFNEVEVDVVFSCDGESWRVPMFWRGGHRWTVRFAPPHPGLYRYHLESTDPDNPDLNAHAGSVTFSAYTGDNELLRRGPLRVSANRRHFVHANGTPFYWLGDTWWMGLSDRLSWEGFMELTQDRRAKGFTVVQLVAGLVPHEEVCPIDPGCHNEGGAVWDPQFHQINPRFFDCADRRIDYLIQQGLVPAIVGAWSHVLEQMGPTKMKKHWRNLIARYGAYPVFWICGGEVLDPPDHAGWTDVTRYIRNTDPYHHPVTAHEVSPDLPAIHDELLTDFHLFQPSHHGWNSIAVEIAQLNLHYARTALTKPLIVGEIGYEMLAKSHLEDFQRAAFWLGMLNGAAGHTYGANGVFESYSAEKQLHRRRWSFHSWREGMDLPGSYQIGLGAQLLRQYPWWRFAPHPEWIAPRGTTLLEPRAADAINGFRANLSSEWGDWDKSGRVVPPSDWRQRGGNCWLPYAAGIAREVRFIYLPNFDLISAAPPTVFALESGVRYKVFYWEPSLGIRVDLGHIEPPPAGEIVLSRAGLGAKDREWLEHTLRPAPAADIPSTLQHGVLSAPALELTNLTINVQVLSETDAFVVLRFTDEHNYIVAGYCIGQRSIFLIERKNGEYGRALGLTPVVVQGATFSLSVELRQGMGVVALRSEAGTYTSPIVPVGHAHGGRFGVVHGPGVRSNFIRFEARHSVETIKDATLERDLYDARGTYRGRISGPGLKQQWLPSVAWDDYARDKHLLLDAYRPELPPTAGDWVLVLDALH
jgi:hypothetical protein